jgi:hypothetical protein
MLRILIGLLLKHCSPVHPLDIGIIDGDDDE